MSKIAICSMSIGDKYREWTKYSRINKIEYCKKYGYDFIEDNSVYDESKPIPWSKLKLILKYIDEYDYIVWIDADIYIMNKEMCLEEMIKEKQLDKDIMVGSDWKYMNTGFLSVKNSEFSKKYLEDVFNHTGYENEDGGQFSRYANWEQGAFINLYDKNHLESQSKIVITEPTFVNCYWYNYFPGFFIIHFAGIRNDSLGHMMHRLSPERKDDDTDESYEARLQWLKVGLREEFDRTLNDFKERERQQEIDDKLKNEKS
jgi:hypothetical protein